MITFHNIRKIVCLGLLFTFHFSLFTMATAQTLPLSPTATASVLTCSAGEEFYTSFGHSALRIQDTALGIDWVYNYGTFDFDTPHFYWKFTKGDLNYCLSRSSFYHFIAVYDSERRGVYEQRLWLTPQEVSNLYVLLETNYLPEYRYYRYDLLVDNCATRVRDMVTAAVGSDRIVYPTSQSLHTSRHYLHQAMRDSLEWWAVGVDLLLGLRTDRRCTPDEAMFYPINIMDLYSSALRCNESGDLPLVYPVTTLLPTQPRPMQRSFPPLIVFALIFVVVALLSWKHLWPKWADRVLFTVAGLVGIFLIFMWTGTVHYCTKWNLNILWASPFFLLIAIRMAKSPRWFLWLQMGMLAVSLIIAVIGWPQRFNIAFIPLILLLALRLFFAIPRRPQQQRQLR